VILRHMSVKTHDCGMMLLAYNNPKSSRKQNISAQLLSETCDPLLRYWIVVSGSPPWLSFSACSQAILQSFTEHTRPCRVELNQIRSQKGVDSRLRLEGNEVGPKSRTIPHQARTRLGSWRSRGGRVCSVSPYLSRYARATTTLSSIRLMVILCKRAVPSFTPRAPWFL
jgi:hypothetical protein